MSARDPSYLGKFALGYSRLGVHAPKWENRIEKLGRDLTWHVTRWHVTRDSVSGHREPDYDTITHTITGVLEERGSSGVSSEFGVYVRLDAVLICLDNVQLKDQIYDPKTRRYYMVTDEPLNHFIGDKSDDGFSFRECHLTYKEFYGKR